MHPCPSVLPAGCEGPYGVTDYAICQTLLGRPHAGQCAWRIVKRRHVSIAFDGEGARLHGGRWNSPGTPVVYVSETRALATLEILAGLRSTAAVHAYVLVAVEFDESWVTSVDSSALAQEWRESPPRPSTQRIGDEWAAARTWGVLRVPSVLVPSESNYVLNPLHGDFAKIVIGESLHAGRTHLRHSRAAPRRVKASDMADKMPPTCARVQACQRGSGQVLTAAPVINIL